VKGNPSGKRWHKAARQERSHLHRWPQGTGQKVSTKNEWTLSLGRDYVDATTFGDTNRTYLVGLRDVSGTFAGIMDVSGDLLVNATTSDIVLLYLYADDGATAGPHRVGSRARRRPDQRQQRGRDPNVGELPRGRQLVDLHRLVSRERLTVPLLAVYG
jgi:hypothetical protein